MFESKYSKFLTVLLVIIVIIVIGLLGYLGYRLFEQYSSTKKAAEAVDGIIEEKDNTDNTDYGDTNQNILDAIPTVETGSGTTKIQRKKYEGYYVDGAIQIPKTNVSYPVLEKVTGPSLEKSVGILYGPGLNEPGNTVIAGHNFRNGQFFSNNKKLVNGDKVIITGINGQKMTYTIYDKFETTEDDTAYMTRDTNGAREISLSTCTDDGSKRLIILAKADQDA